MAVKLAPNPRQQFEDANGNPYVGAKLFTYAAGSTTKQTTYTDNIGLTANTNPIILDSAGRTPYGVWLTAGLTYKFVLAPSTDTDPPSSPIFTEDFITGVNDSTTTVSQWTSPLGTPTYISATQFSMVGDQRIGFQVGRRLKFTVTAGTVYGRVTVSAYTSLTTITVVLDSGALDSGLSAVEYGVLTPASHSIPALSVADLTAIGIQPLDDQLTTLAGITAQQATDLASLSPLVGTLLNDVDRSGAQGTLGTILHTLEYLTAAHTVVSANWGKFYSCYSTFTISMDPVATLGRGFSFAVRNDGSGTITLDPSGAETIDNFSQITLAPTESCFVVSDGGAWKTVGRSGKVLQVVHYDTGAVATGSTIIPLDDTIPQNTEGDQYMSLAITPKSATSILRVDVSYKISPSAVAWITGALFRDATASSIATSSLYHGHAGGGISDQFSVKVVSGSTATTTFNVRIGPSAAATLTFNGLSGARLFGGVMSSSIRITEIAS